MNIVIIGASRGLGHALAKGLKPLAHHFFLLSRTQPQVLQEDPSFRATWIQADLRKPDFVAPLLAALAYEPVDLLIYNAGIWEPDAFTDAYDFATSDPALISELISVNLTSAILCVQALLPNLSQAAHAQILLMGSTSGMVNNKTREVAYQASKFGLRGLNNAIRENLRGTLIRSTLLNLGDLSTHFPYEQGIGVVQESVGYGLIPVEDIVILVRCICSLSPASLIKELDIVGIRDQAV